MAHPHLLIFTLDGQRYALSLDNVAQVTRAAALTPLPQAPGIVLGILDLHGEIVPVVNLRKRFRLPERGIRSDDLFLLARTAKRRLILVVDATDGVVDAADCTATSADDIVSGMEFVAGVTRTAQGLVLIHDLETLLFPDEEKLLQEALEQAI